LNENQKAIDILNECIKDEQNNPSTNALLAHCLAITGKFDESNEHFRKALHFWRNNPIMMISLDTFFNSYGIELLNTGKLKEAAHAFGEAFKANPLNANAYNNMGVTLLKMKNPKNALIAFKKAVELGHPNKDEIVIVIDKIEAMMKK
jgi:Flp pilus assembly protein TadD